MKFLDNLLNRVTMYRLVEYVLMALIGIAAIFGFAGKIPYNGFSIIVTAGLLVVISWLANAVFAWAFEAPRHDDSAYLTGLILALIIVPVGNTADPLFYFWAPVLAIASKYILAIRKQHLFNPAAFAVALTAMTIGQSAIWWVGNGPMLIPMLLGGFLIVRKIRRWDVVYSFGLVAIGGVIVAALLRHASIIPMVEKTFTGTAIVFFATVMLTEPVTMPGTKYWRYAFGAVVGLFFIPQFHIGKTFFSPEQALLIGNLAFFFITRRQRYVLTLREKIQTGPNLFDFVFAGPQPVKHRSGQYMEFMVPHKKADGRGLRRYFTLASAATEPVIRLGVKTYAPSSTYKQALVQMMPGDTIVASQLGGDFTLPSDVKKKLVFIAGGIGITPFRSMVKEMIDRVQKRDVVLLYAAQSEAELVYRDIFTSAQLLGVRAHYVLGDEKKIRPDWAGGRGFITAEVIRQQAPDFSERTFYISGPQKMVDAFVKTLHGMGLRGAHIKTDYFPGFA